MAKQEEARFVAFLALLVYSSSVREPKPITYQTQLNAIAESLVVLRGSREWRQEDIVTVTRLSNWINYDFKEI